MLSSIEAMLSFRVIGCYSSIGRNRGRKHGYGFYVQDGAVSIIFHSDDYEDHMSAELELLSVRETSNAEEEELRDTGDAVAVIVDSDDYEDGMPELELLSIREASTAEEQEVCDTGDAVAVIVDSDDCQDDMPELCSLSSDDSCSEEDQLSKDY